MREEGSAISVEVLTRLVAPPEDPVEAAGDWGPIEAAVGCSLPVDYKALVQRYGTGEFCDLVVLQSPFVGGKRWPTLLLDFTDDHEMREEFPEDYPYPLYPEPDGLLVWAYTSNGDRLCWLTEGASDAWPVMVWTPRGGYYERHDTTPVGFLAGWISGQLRCRLLPEADPTVDPWFDPPRELSHVYVRLTPADPDAYDQRLQVLRASLHPTANRGSHAQPEDRQDSFVATERGWQFVYESWPYRDETGKRWGEQLRVAFPPEDEQAAKEAVRRAVASMGCSVHDARAVRGELVWTDLAE